MRLTAGLVLLASLLGPGLSHGKPWAPLCRKEPVERMVSSVAREPATYLPRAAELKEEIALLEIRARGFQQDILDFRKSEDRFRQTLRDYRRLYPDSPGEAEARVESLYRTFQPAYQFFKGTLRPTEAECHRLINEMESRFLSGPTSRMPEPEDADLAKRLVQKLCRLPVGD